MVSVAPWIVSWRIGLERIGRERLQRQTPCAVLSKDGLRKLLACDDHYQNYTRLLPTTTLTFIRDGTIFEKRQHSKSKRVVVGLGGYVCWSGFHGGEPCFHMRVLSFKDGKM